MTYEVITIPVFIMIMGVFVLPLLPKSLRSFAFIVFPSITLYLIFSSPDNLVVKSSFVGYEIILFKVDSLNRIFGVIFALITIIGGIFSYHIKQPLSQTAALLYSGSAIGITFAGDYITLLFFWELMAIASTYLIWSRRTKESEQAGMRYLIIHIFGGSLLLAGILIHINNTNSITISPLIEDNSLSSLLILVGVGFNAAIPPIHAWLTDAYPKATVTGAVFLSAFTTKSAVLILIKIFAGWEILIFLGVIMTLYGVIYAVISNDIREILAYHIISQVGYMVTGVGIGTEMSINGSTAHAFSHIIYKALLFMGAGVVLHTTGKSKLTELGGLAKQQSIVFWLYLVGGFSISGFPLLNGFISKSMVVAAAGNVHLELVVLLLLLASVGTFLSTTLKIPYFTWWTEPKNNITQRKPPLNMIIGMAMAAFFCFLFGVYPSLLYNYLPYPVDYQPYTLYHLTESVQILTFTFIAFWLLKGKLEGKPYIVIDTDYFYRKPVRFVKKIFVDSIEYIFNFTEFISYKIVSKLIIITKNPFSFVHFKQKGLKYNPVLYRPSIELLTLLILFSFVLFALISFISRF